MRALIIRLAASALAATLTPPALAQFAPGQIPEIPAFLPMASAVPMTEASPIDGTWTITSIGKRIRIEGGRAYAVDPWLHMFVLKIQPGMVVIRNIRSADGRTYTGEDLPLMGAFTGTLSPQGSLDVSVAGALGPVRYSLSPVELDNRSWYQQIMAGGSPVAPPATLPAPPPGAAPIGPPPVPVEPRPVDPQPVAAAPPPDDEQAGGGVTCKEVVYQEETDDFACIR